jgi:hypothetical protein
MKESYENIELLLEKIQYEKYTWNICGFLAWLAAWLQNVCCFLCEWDSRHRNIQKQQPESQCLFQDREM